MRFIGMILLTVLSPASNNPEFAVIPIAVIGEMAVFKEAFSKKAYFQKGVLIHAFFNDVCNSVPFSPLHSSALCFCSTDLLKPLS